MRKTQFEHINMHFRDILPLCSAGETKENNSLYNCACVFTKSLPGQTINMFVGHVTHSFGIYDQVTPNEGSTRLCGQLTDLK